MRNHRVGPTLQQSSLAGESGAFVTCGILGHVVFSKHACGTKQPATLPIWGVIKGRWWFALGGLARTILTTRMAVTHMHRDTKLGLALAILVMGFAAALCFPRESGEKPVDLTLQTAADLDEAIRLMPVKSYTDADRPRPRGTAVTPVAPLPAEAIATHAAQSPPGVPDPIEIPRAPEPTPIDPGHFPAEIVAQPEPEPEPVVPTRTYRVQSGDSLSLIADRQLGDHRKWSTLFNANRRLLHTENDLKPGMELIIPIESRDVVTPTPQNTVPTGSAAAVAPLPPVSARSEAPPTRATGRFSPPRTRLGAGGTSTVPDSGIGPK